ncbi:hypothetical protein ACHHV8_11140 [Paenibacillus sp. TAB 01]|uniref:hypothetical protein n=1 Tax=Paenibacillus sp. TAB 01 TaxID=3368988 RepID=UPI003752DF28
MMKVTVECTKCGNKVELTPVTNGQHAYLNRNLRENDFRIHEVVMPVEITSSPYMDFTDKLTQSRTNEETNEILDDDIRYNVDLEKKLEEVRIDCGNCGDYIVLTEFE